MSDKFLSFSEMAEVEALNVHELCLGAVDPESDENHKFDISARERIHELVKQDRFVALNKASRGLESHKDASMFFEICEGEAISTSIQQANGSKYLCKTMFIPVSFSLSPLNQDQAIREIASIKPVLPSQASKKLKSILRESFGATYEVLPFLFDELEIFTPANKEIVRNLCQLYGTYVLSGGLGNSAGHDERFIEFMSDNLDVESGFNFANGTFDVIRFVLVATYEKIPDKPDTKLSHDTSLGLPVKLLSNRIGDDIAAERRFISEATDALQNEYNKIEEVDIFVSVGSPQIYAMLDLGHVLSTAGTVVRHMSSILGKVAHCDLLVEVDKISSEISLSFRFKQSLDKYDNENMALRIPYVPFRPNNPLTEIELQQSYIQNIVGIGCTLSVES